MKVEIELDDLNELKEEIASLQMELANQSYKGNSIGYIYDKMKVYANDSRATCRKFSKAVKEGHIKIHKGVDDDEWIARRLRIEEYLLTAPAQPREDKEE